MAKPSIGDGQLLESVETWTTADLRPGREAERWLNTLLRRTE